MPKIIRVKDDNTEVFLDERDFANIISKYMGSDAAAYYLELVDYLDYLKDEVKWYD